MNLISAITDNHEMHKQWRKEFHAYPEDTIRPEKTMTRVAELLREFGFDEIEQNFGETGLVGVLRNGEGPMVGFISPLDGEQLQEIECITACHAGNKSCMHMVGHDGELTMMLAAAQYLAASRNFQGSVAFIFFSAQSAGMGARSMIEAGLFDSYPVSELYSLYNIPCYPAGKIAASAGPVVGAVGELLVKITGLGGNPAFPNRTRNPILALAAMVNSLETLASRTVNPALPLVVGVTSVVSGDAFDKIPSEAELKGTIRFMDPQIEAWLPERVDSLVSKIAESYETKSVISYRMVCPPTVNAVEPASFVRRMARETVGVDHVSEIQPVTLMGSDLAYFFQEVPGVCIAIGNASEAQEQQEQYEFNDDVLPIGATLLARIVEDCLGRVVTR